MSDWKATGPDAFGDFNITSKGEQLVKCVVVQNGFRTPEETRATSELIIKAINSHESLVEALKDTLNMLRAAHMQCGVAHDSNKRVIKAREVLARTSGQV